MIGKVASSGRDFNGVIKYLINGSKGAALNPARVAWVETRNMIVGEPRLAARLMKATARRSVRCKAPVYHFLVSWHRNEAPSDEMMREVADTTCRDLGLGEYQRLLVAHDDTAHRHVHIVVNRIHPETGRAWNRRQDFVRIEQSLRRQSEALGLPPVRGRERISEHQAEAAAPTGAPVRVRRPLVTEMDILLGLYRMGLAERRNVDKANEERQNRLDEAPAAVQIAREMRQALRSVPRGSRFHSRAAAQLEDPETTSTANRSVR